MSFSMANSAFGNAFGPENTWRRQLLGFAGDVAQGADQFRTSAQDVLKDTYNTQAMFNSLENQPENNLLNQLKTTNEIQTAGYDQQLNAQKQNVNMLDYQNQQLEQEARLFVNQCVANGGDPYACRAQFDLSVGRTAQPQTNMSYAPNMPSAFNINSLLGS